MGIVSRKVKKRFFIAIAVIIIITAIGIFFPKKVHRAVTLEAGEETPSVSQFMKKDGIQGTFITDVSAIDMSVPGVYEIKVQIGKRVYTSKLKVVDTISPVSEVMNQKIPFGETLKAEAFVTDIVDATEVTVSFIEEPDFTLVGEQDVFIILEDAGNNKTELTALLSIGKVHEFVTVEVGKDKLDASEFMMSSKLIGSFVTDVSKIDLNSLGQFDIVIECDGDEYISQLKIVDTIAPKADIVNQEAWVNDELEADRFVENIVDHTDVKTYFKEKPDFGKAGEQNVFVILEDTSGNKTELKASLTMIEDTEPPEIKGDDKRLVYIGEKVSYRNHVTVTDNRDEDVKLEVDSSSVNLKKQGTYIVTYKATDSSGNTATKDVVYIIKQKPKNYVSKEEIDILADEVLKSIIKDNMSQRKKARAIYDWIRSRIAYVSYTNNTDWVRAAYDGIKGRRGDCYVYFATAKQLLTRAGIENMDIVKINGRHFWNMVNLGDGWYHFDTTPRTRGGEFFMLTDAQLEAHSKKDRNSHVWDRSKYPATPLE